MSDGCLLERLVQRKTLIANLTSKVDYYFHSGSLGNPECYRFLHFLVLSLHGADCHGLPSFVISHSSSENGF